MTNPSLSGALAGVRVLDISRVLAGPYCGQMLADHGADVIKVESPVGDDTRTWGPPFRDGTAAYYDGLNRGKRNICIDLRSPAGQRVLRDLLDWAEVVVENFKVGTLEGWGFDARSIMADDPALIWCRISGYGDDGPLGGRPGYDAVLQAGAGLMSVNGYPDRDPLRVGVPIVDLLAGNQAFTGVVLALFARERTGRGQLVEVTLFDTALSLLHPQAANWFAGGPTPTRTGDTHPSVVPYQTFESRDGPLFIGAANDRAFEVLCQVLERPDLLHDERYRTNGDRVRNAPALAAELARTIAERPGDELADALLARGVAASPVNDVPTVLQHPHTRHRQMVLDIDGQRSLGVPVKLAGTPAHPHTAPRAKGADTLEILGMLGTFGDSVEGYVKPLKSPDTFVVTDGTG